MNKTLIIGLAHAALGFVLAPLLPGIINRVKAWFAGRRGPPLLQMYYDIIKLLRKGAVYGAPTSWVFRMSGPVVLACGAIALLIVPFAGQAAPLAFGADIVVFAYVLGLMRFCTIIAALDTASAFEGMGASREALFSALAEPALFLGVAALAGKTGWMSLSSMLPALPPFTAERLLVGAALLIVYLCENARIPIDDPATHLELTMIHEVMILDHSGVELGMVELAASLKLWILGALVIGIVVPMTGHGWILNCFESLAAMALLAAGVGVIESVMARLRLLRVPHLLIASGAIAAVALLAGAR